MDKKSCFFSFKQLLILFTFGLLGGCIYFNILWQIQGAFFQNEWEIWMEHFMRLSFGEMLKKCWEIKYWLGGILVFILTIGFTKIGKVVVEGGVLSFGFLIGAAETLLLLGFQFEESIKFISKLLAVNAFNICLVGSCIIIAHTMSGIWKMTKNKSLSWKRIQIKKYVFLGFCGLIIYMVYTIFLNYVN